MERLMNCHVCKKETMFISTESPDGFWVCGHCSYRFSKDKRVLKIAEHGYQFEVE